MERSILLECLSADELKEIIREIFREELLYIKNDNKIDSEEILTRKETASLLKISLTALWNWTKNGEIPSYGLGRKLYYKKSEVVHCLRTV
jgi:excisionase family DNA binding protein